MGTTESRLRKMGLTYEGYRASEDWRRAEYRYEESGLPTRCLGCGSGEVSLRHRSYQRLGCEVPTDLIPLCNACFFDASAYMDAKGMTSKDIHAALRAIHGWAKSKMIAVFEPYRLPGRPNGFNLTPKD